MEKRRAQAVLKSLQPYTAQPGAAQADVQQQLQLVQQLCQQCQEQLDRYVIVGSVLQWLVSSSVLFAVNVAETTAAGTVTMSA